MTASLLATGDSHPLETVPDEESAMIEQVVSRQIDIMKAGDPSKRGQHPKHQALLLGRFEIAEKIPAPLRAGLFARPGTYDAFVRVSTGPMPKDSDPNPHAMAIKLVEVPGAPQGTQDLIMLDQPTFFIRDVADYVAFFEAMTNGSEGGDFYKTHPREYGLNLTFNVVIGSQMERQYWSEVPIAMGAGAARLTLIPDPANQAGYEPARSENGLREVLADHFVRNRRDATFHFAAQSYLDEATTPIEDATSVWPTPFEIIATLTLPAQDFLSRERQAFGEALSYTPWHCLAAHQPLGGIQRCRKRVYEESQRLRHELSGMPDREPSGDDYARLAKFL